MEKKVISLSHSNSRDRVIAVIQDALREAKAEQSSKGKEQSSKK